MMTPDDTIIHAIQHPNLEVQHLALARFTQSRSADPRVMPAVIQVVHRDGLRHGYSLLRDAEKLAQTPDTVAWLMQELRQGYNLDDIDEDNYVHAVALVLAHAAPVLLQPLASEARLMPAMPEMIREWMDDRLRLAAMSWPERWDALIQWGRETCEKQEMSTPDRHRGERIVEALAYSPTECAEVLGPLLRRKFPRDQTAVMEWLEQSYWVLTGMARLEEHAPLLIKRLLGVVGDDDLIWDANELSRALKAMAGPRTARAVAQSWWASPTEARGYFAEVLEYSWCELALERSLTFLEREEDAWASIELARAAIMHFDPVAVPHVLDSLDRLQPSTDPDVVDLKGQVVAACTIMGVSFPQKAEWQADDDILQASWREKAPHVRLADSLRGDFKFLTLDGKTGGDDSAR